METKVQKWGNSLGVRLPKTIADSQLLSDGSRVRITEINQQIIIEALREPTLQLADLVAAISPQNLHTEHDWGKARGNEVW
jgi:antitoxin MazE